MKVYSNNFDFIIGTSLEKLFKEDLFISEVSLALKSNLPKIIARKIAEYIAKEIYRLQTNINTDKLSFEYCIKNISNIIGYRVDDFDIIRKNGNDVAHVNLSNNYTLNGESNEQIMQRLQNILLWYLSKIKKEKEIPIKKYIRPEIETVIDALNLNKSSIDNLKNDINVKDYKIYELNRTIDGLNTEIKTLNSHLDKSICEKDNDKADYLKVILEYDVNKKIMEADSEEKEFRVKSLELEIEDYEQQRKKLCSDRDSLNNQLSKLALNEKELLEAINDYRRFLEEARRLSMIEQTRITKLQGERDEAQFKYVEKEKQLVKIEHENERLLKELKDLRNKDVKLEEKIKETELELDNLKITCKNSYDLLNEYQELIEKCKFAYSAPILVKLEEHKDKAKENLIDDDKKFSIALTVADTKLKETVKRKDAIKGFFQIRVMKI